MLISSKRYKEFGNIYSFLNNAEIIGQNFHEVNLLKSFLSFIKMKSISYIGISEKNYWEYLLELIIKFNLRDENYYRNILNLLKISRVAETTQSPNI
jgi:hypothetical protein